jgi:Spy/CpxP family protein refolding chaperone
MSEAPAVRQRAALWVALVFLLGAALGCVAGYVYAAHRTALASGRLTGQAKRAQKVERLTRELNLTADQQRQLDAVLADVQAKYKAIHQTIEPQVSAVRHEAREKIRAFLTPEQKPKFEEFLRRLDEERKQNGWH